MISVRRYSELDCKVRPYLRLAIDKHTVNFESRMSNGYKALDRRIQGTVLPET